MSDEKEIKTAVEFIETLLKLQRDIISHLSLHEELLQRLLAKDIEREHQLDIILENQVGHRPICGDNQCLK